MFHKINIQFTEEQINNIGTLGIINKGRGFQDFIESKLFEQLNLNLKPLLLNEITYESMTNKETQNLNMSASIFLTSSQKVNDALKFLENNLDEEKFKKFKEILNIN